MPDPRRNLISTGILALAPAEAPEKWAVRSSDESPAVEAHWGEWVRLAKRILDADALSRDLEGRGDAWDLGHAAGAADASGSDTINPFR